MFGCIYVDSWENSKRYLGFVFNIIHLFHKSKHRMVHYINCIKYVLKFAYLKRSSQQRKSFRTHIFDIILSTVRELIGWRQKNVIASGKYKRNCFGINTDMIKRTSFGSRKIIYHENANNSKSSKQTHFKTQLHYFSNEFY